MDDIKKTECNQTTRSQDFWNNCATKTSDMKSHDECTKQLSVTDWLCKWYQILLLYTIIAFLFFFIQRISTD